MKISTHHAMTVIAILERLSTIPFHSFGKADDRGRERMLEEGAALSGKAVSTLREIRFETERVQDPESDLGLEVEGRLENAPETGPRPPLVCHAPGDRCLGCKAYRDGAGVCHYENKPLEKPDPRNAPPSPIARAENAMIRAARFLRKINSGGIQIKEIENIVRDLDSAVVALNE